MPIRRSTPRSRCCWTGHRHLAWSKTRHPCPTTARSGSGATGCGKACGFGPADAGPRRPRRVTLGCRRAMNPFKAACAISRDTGPHPMQHLLPTHPHNPSTGHANPSGNKTGSNGARLIATSATAKTAVTTAAMTETTPSAAMNAHSASQTRHSNLMAIAPTAISPATPYRW